MKLLLLLGTCFLLALGLGGSSALGASTGTCSGGTISGTVGNVTVTGFCGVAAPGVTINGNLTLADGAVFAPVDSEFNFWPVHVKGNIKVGKGAQLLLGWDAPEGQVGSDTVDGNIVANQPLALYLGNLTVHGNVVSNGGGSSDRFYNFPIKDNVIDGNLIIHGWTGGWWGVIANSVGGNVDLSNNRSVVQPAGTCEGTFPTGCDAAPGADIDAGEVQARPDNPQNISGNLICHDNAPTVQVNMDDHGAVNTVGGRSIGECPPRISHNGTG